MNHQSTPSWQSSSKFREHLSVIVPPVDAPITRSKFSPDSPPSISHKTSKSSGSFSRYCTTKDVEAASQSPRSGRSALKDRFTKFFFDLRTLKEGNEPDMVPIQPRYPPTWPALHVEEKCCKCHDEKETKRRRWWIIALIIVLLYLLADTIFLNASVVTLLSDQNNSQGSSSPSQPNSTPVTLPTNAQQCISQYEINAPTDPSTYPCSTCLPILQSIPANFAFAKEQDAQQVVNAIQFCGLSALFNEANSDGQGNLSNAGWLRDVRFCAWNGVSCDGSGRVSTLQLTFPGVPVVLPDELGGLDGLQSLTVIGNNAIPGGALPAGFSNLTSLATLHLEASTITAIPDGLFTSLNQITTLTLVRNTQMGNNLPSSIFQTSLQNLVVNSQTLSNPLSNLASSSSLQSSLKLIDFSSTSMTGSIPGSVSAFSALTELHLDNNNLQGSLPTTFPPHLQLLTLSNNTGVTGAVPGALCSSSVLKTCDLSSTGLSFSGGSCGPCHLT